MSWSIWIKAQKKLIILSSHPSDVCTFCGWPKQNKAEKPIEVIVSSPMEVESCMERMMDMQDELFQLGVLPADDEDGEGEDSDEDEYFLVAGPYRIPIKDMYDETQPAFDSGMYDTSPD